MQQVKKNCDYVTDCIIWDKGKGRVDFQSVIKMN